MAQGALLFQSVYLLCVGLAMLGVLFIPGKRYWFSIPYTGIGLAFACYSASLVAALV